MAAITVLYPLTPGRYSSNGSFPGVREVVWHCEVDEPMDGGDIIRQAWARGLPRKGAHLVYTSPSGYTFQDRDSYALDFLAEPLFRPDEDNQTKWRIVVGYRPPHVGQDEFPANVHLPPLARPPEYWIEYGQGSRMVIDAHRVLDEDTGRIEDKRTPLTNAAGQIIDNVFESYRTAILVAAYNTRLITDGLTLTEKYENTTNSKDFTIIGNTPIKKHHARFMSAETSRMWEMGTRYPRLELRIEIGRRPFYEQFENVGDYSVEQSGSQVEVASDDNGRVVPPPIRLKKDGSKVSFRPAQQTGLTKEDRVRQYLTLTPIEYVTGNGNLQLRVR